jgi:rubrerythrin
MAKCTGCGEEFESDGSKKICPTCEEKEKKFNKSKFNKSKFA